MSAADALPDFLTSNVIGDLQTHLERGPKTEARRAEDNENDWEDLERDEAEDDVQESQSAKIGTPYLYNLLCVLTRNKLSIHRSNRRLKGTQNNKPNDFHVIVMVICVLFNSWNRGHRKFQTWVGMWLLASGVKMRVIETLQRYGLSVGPRSTEVTVSTIAEAQKQKLVQVGSEVPTLGLILCYDNINVHETKGQERQESKDKQYNGIVGFVTPTHKPLVRRDAIQSDLLKDVDASDLLATSERLSAYDKELQCRQVENAIEKFMFTPSVQDHADLAQNSALLDNNGKLWKFDPLENARLCPSSAEHPAPCRVLQYNPSEAPEKYSLAAAELEELSHMDTTTYIDHIRRDQLKINTLPNHILFTVGDLATVRAVHAAKRLRSEDSDDISKLEWLFPIFGLFHLNQNYLQTILKQFHKPGCRDYAHLDAIIQTLGLHSFNNGKSPYHRRTEDLLYIYYRSAILSWFKAQFSDTTGVMSPSDHTALVTRELKRLGKNGVRSLIRDKMYPALFSHSARAARKMKQDELQQDQAGELLYQIGLYLELKEAQKYGTVGKFPSLFRLLLTWYAGTNNHNYTRELVKMLLLEQSMTKDAFDAMLSALLIRAKRWFKPTDIEAEEEVRVNKDVYNAKGGSFKWHHMVRDTALIANTLNDTTIAVQNSHRAEKQRLRGKHYNPSMQGEVASIADHIYRGRLFDRISPALAEIEQSDVYNNGCEALQTYDIQQAKSYVFDMRFEEPDDISSGGIDDNGLDVRVDPENTSNPADPDRLQADDEEFEGTDTEEAEIGRVEVEQLHARRQAAADLLIVAREKIAAVLEANTKARRYGMEKYSEAELS